MDWAGENHKGERLWRCGSEGNDVKGHMPFALTMKKMDTRLKHGKHPCITCNGKKRYMLWQLHEYAETKGGSCLTLDQDDKKYYKLAIEFKCFNSKHPKFRLTDSQALSDEMWCDRCRDKPNKPYTTEDVKELCERKDVVLPENFEYENRDAKIILKCNRQACDEFKFEKTFNWMLKNKDKTWCEYCLIG